jgi:hypothetical protein
MSERRTSAAIVTFYAAVILKASSQEEFASWFMPEIRKNSPGAMSPKKPGNVPSVDFLDFYSCLDGR